VSQVTVLMPARNAAPFIGAAVESVRSQTCDAWRLIVIDDGSTDTTADIVRSAGDARISVVRSPGSGIVDALNLGLSLADTPFVARMDADDLSRAGRFTVQLATLEADYRLSLVGSQVDRLSGTRIVSTSNLPQAHDNIVRALCRGFHAIAHSSCMFRTEAAKRVGGYRRIVAEDWDFYLRMSEVGSLANVAESLLTYRFHESNITASSLYPYRLSMYRTISNYRRRVAGLDDRPFEEFVRTSGRRVEFRARREAAALAFYRQAMVRDAGLASKMKSVANLGAASLLYPEAALRRLRG